MARPLDPSGNKTELVYVINSLHTGGAEVGMCRLLDSLSPQEYHITIIALNGHSTNLTDQIPNWVHIVDLRLKSGVNLAGIRELYSALRTAEVVVGSLFHSSMLVRFTKLLNSGTRIVTWRHSTQFTSYFRKQIFYWTAGLNDIILADSKPVAEMLVNELGLNEETIHTVPIAGINLDNYSPVRHTKTDNIIVGTVGRLTKAKNYSAVLDIAEQFKNSNVQFRIAGDGELYEELISRIDRRNISNVTLFGHVENVPEFLSELDIYLQPSRREGLCITVLEAMAAGLPVVGSRVGGINQNVEHGNTGFLYDPNNIDKFATALEHLASDPELRQQFGERAREMIAESFTKETLKREFEKAISK